MKKFKVAIVFALCVSLMIVMAACGGNAAPPAAEAPAAEAPAAPAAPETDGDILKMEMNGHPFEFDTSIPATDREYAMAYTNVASQFGALEKAGTDQAAIDFGINAYMIGGTDWNPTELIEILENLITKGVDALGVNGIYAESVTPYINQAMAAGIPVITFNGDAEESDRLGYVGANYVDHGAGYARDVMEEVVKKYPNGGKMLVTGVTIANQISQDRLTGIRAVVDEFTGNYPDCQIEIIVQDCPVDDSGAYSTCENLFFTHQQDTVAWCDLSNTGIIIGQVLMNNDAGNANSDKPVYNGSADIYEDRLIQIIEGWGTSVWSQNPFDMGYQPVRMFYEFFDGSYDPAILKEIVDTQLYGVTAVDAQDFLDRLRAGEPIG